MFIVKYYVAAAVLFAVAAFIVAHWYFAIVFAWLSVSFTLVSGAYLFKKPEVFRKRANGSIPTWSSWLFWPFLLGAQLYNAWARRRDKVPAVQEIEPKLFLACRLFPSEIDSLKRMGVTSILDATAEFSGLNWSAEDASLDYKNVPILDHTIPELERLQSAINWVHNKVRAGDSVVIHCALGRGRSVMILAAYLLAANYYDDVDQALKAINKVRGTANLNSRQLSSLKKMYADGVLNVQRSMLLIANPTSGQQKWLQFKEEIESELSSKFQITVEETTKSRNAFDIATDYLESNIDLMVACGGDGTINEVASAIVDTDICLGLIPLGTTNALCHVLFGYKAKMQPVSIACDVLMNGTKQKLDAAKCNKEVFLLVAGVGFEQQMIANADRSKKNENGELAYIHALTQAFSNNDLQEYEMNIDGGETQHIEASSIVVANAAPFSTILAQGGDEPDPTDGLLDITILNTKEALGGPIVTLGFKSMARAFTDTHDTNEITYYKAKKIALRTKGKIEYVIDGETREDKSLEIKVMPKSLNVMLPKE